MTPTAQVPYLRVRDLDRSIAFYRDALGFRVERSLEEDGHTFWARLVSGGAAIMLSDRRARSVAHADDEAHEHRDWHGVGDALNPWPDLNALTFLYVEDCDAAFERVARGGYDVLQPPQDQPWGIRDLVVRDPDGYVYAVAHHLTAAAH